MVGVTDLFRVHLPERRLRKGSVGASEQLKDLRAREDGQLTSIPTPINQKGVVAHPVIAPWTFVQESAAGKLFYPGKPSCEKETGRHSGSRSGAAPATAAAAAPAHAQKEALEVPR